MDSYAYNPENKGHKYINSPQLDEDLKQVAEQMKEGQYGNNIDDSSSRHT